MPNKVIINAYDNPTSASKFEADIGALMLRNETRAGHKAMLPVYSDKLAQCQQPKNPRGASYDPAVLNFIAANPGSTKKEMSKQFNLSGMHIHAIINRLTGDGKIIAKRAFANGPNLHYVVQDALAKSDCGAG